MEATLIDCCTYRDGLIERTDGMDADITTDAAELIEEGLSGWGRANAVVRVDGKTYLAAV